MTRHEIDGQEIATNDKFEDTSYEALLLAVRLSKFERSDRVFISSLGDISFHLQSGAKFNHKMMKLVDENNFRIKLIDHQEHTETVKIWLTEIDE